MTAAAAIRPAYPALPSVRVGSAPFASVTERQCIDHVLGELDAGRGGWLVTINLDVLRRYERDAYFRDLIRESSFFVADGMPLIWASRLRAQPLPERVAGSTLMVSLSEACAKRGKSIFLLGGNEGAAEGAAAELTRRFPSLRIAGTCYPPFGFEKDDAKMAEIRAAIAASRPDVVYVALGCPKQERLIVALRPLLPHAWFTGVGISFSFLSGEVRRAPRWMQQTGLEWVHRMVQEPGRLMKRYLVDNAPFALALLARSGAERFRKSPRDTAGAHA